MPDDRDLHKLAEQLFIDTIYAAACATDPWINWVMAFWLESLWCQILGEMGEDPYGPYSTELMRRQFLHDLGSAAP